MKYIIRSLIFILNRYNLTMSASSLDNYATKEDFQNKLSEDLYKKSSGIEQNTEMVRVEINEIVISRFLTNLFLP